MPTNKPDLTRIWASSANPENIIDPDIGEDGKFNAGWVSELPPFEYFNFMYKMFTEGMAHMNEYGIPVWDSKTVYPIKAWTRGSDGLVYQAISQQSGNNPVSSSSHWQSLSELFKSKEINTKIIKSSQSWAVPNGVTKILIEVVAAGGGGGGGDDGHISGAGANGTSASNTTVSYGSITAVAIGGVRAAGIGSTNQPTIETPEIVGGSVSGSPISSEVIPGGGSAGGVGGVGQTLDDSDGLQGGTGGTGGTGGKVILELAVTTGSINIAIGNVGRGGAGKSSNSNNDGSDGSPSYVKLTWLG